MNEVLTMLFYDTLGLLTWQSLSMWPYTCNMAFRLPMFKPGAASHPNSFGL